MPKKTPKKYNARSNSPFTKIQPEKGQQTQTSQQKTSTSKKIQNNKAPKPTNSKNTKLTDKIESSNSENELEEQEFNNELDNELGNEDEDIVMQDISLDTLEEDSTDSSDDENPKKINYSEEENSIEENVDEEIEENYNEIVKDTTKISLKKQKEKEKITSQDKTTSKEIVEIKDPTPMPLLARPEAEKQFHDYYMNQITKAFGEDLDELRKKEVNLNSKKLEILIDTLESGISIFSDVEKELALLSSNKK